MPGTAADTNRSACSEATSIQPAIVQGKDSDDSADKWSGVLRGVDIYGSDRVDTAMVLSSLDRSMGESVDSDVLSQWVPEFVFGLHTQLNFVHVRVAPVYYPHGAEFELFITVDLVEADDLDRIRFAPAPNGQLADPHGLIARWMMYEERGFALVRGNKLESNVSSGCRGGFHCAFGFDHPELREFESFFIDGVPSASDDLLGVLREHRDPQWRAAAAFLLAYLPTREAVVKALVPAINDINSSVRNNVLRVLGSVQAGQTRPLLPLNPLLLALDFPDTTDRNKASLALLALLTAQIDRPEFDTIKSRVSDQVGDVLVRMAAMAQPNNREPAVKILELISGQKDTGTAAWRQWLDNH